uniref:Ribonuclease H-like domain-containing protein n=1 Tax=Tanacetum cinerariifolium TaxID=118510 RepID=A0A699JPJ2_TANCI|nr:ribonuclease H-like domain-containing protein [Tanacetum cinerariifolium]
MVNMAQQYLLAQQPMYPTLGPVLRAPPNGSVQTFPTTASTGSVGEESTSGAWNMDTVGDGHSIPVTNTDHSILPTPLKSLHLNNDFMTRRVLLRCNSTGDLYPVTDPSSIPHVFLVSQHKWHQCLGHPGREVLRHLVSNNFISCNKEKPFVLCHAFQPRNHVGVPFASSNTVVTSCFDIIHSDALTSPILSLSWFKYYVLFLDHYS